MSGQLHDPADLNVAETISVQQRMQGLMDKVGGPACLTPSQHLQAIQTPTARSTRPCTVAGINEPSRTQNLRAHSQAQCSVATDYAPPTHPTPPGGTPFRESRLNGTLRAVERTTSIVECDRCRPPRSPVLSSAQDTVFGQQTPLLIISPQWTSELRKKRGISYGLFFFV